MGSCYQRVKRYRTRKRCGRVVLNVECDLGAIADLLIDAGYLGAWNAESRIEVEKALETALEVWARA
jgi:hypothetical protein